jgi:hypothetical protein
MIYVLPKIGFWSDQCLNPCNIANISYFTVTGGSRELLWLNNNEKAYASL